MEIYVKYDHHEEYVFINMAHVLSVVYCPLKEKVIFNFIDLNKLEIMDHSFDFKQANLPDTTVKDIYERAKLLLMKS